MEISPGNLYYHFSNKDEIVFELYAQHEAEVLPLYATAADARSTSTTCGCGFTCCSSRCGNIAFCIVISTSSRRSTRSSARASARSSGGASATVIQLGHGLAKAGAMRASEREIESLAQNVVLVAAYWSSYDRVRERRGRRTENDPAAPPIRCWRCSRLISTATPAPTSIGLPPTICRGRTTHGEEMGRIPASGQSVRA
jgi:AcrR family transcriptional regulator